jgi:predicted DNA-binding protein
MARMRRIHFRVTDDQYAWLKAESLRTGKSMSAIIREAIAYWLEQQPPR